MWSFKFFRDAAERIISTAAQALLATMVTSVPWGTKLTIAGLAALASLLKALAASTVGDHDSASLLPGDSDG